MYVYNVLAHIAHGYVRKHVLSTHIDGNSHILYLSASRRRRPAIATDVYIYIIIYIQRSTYYSAESLYSDYFQPAGDRLRFMWLISS